MLLMPCALDLGVPRQIVLRLIAKLSVKILSTPGHGALESERLDDVMGLKVTKIHFLISVDITVRDEARLIGQHIIPLRRRLATGGPHPHTPNAPSLERRA
jgi:hypothetical protein